VQKTYRVRVRPSPVPDAALTRLRDGVELDDGPTAPADVRRVGADVLEITIGEGRNRQVRRMVEAVGHRVESLERTAFGPLGLAGLEPGESRRLTEDEIERLRRIAAR
jgi:23S rRNA pseudouridine2605 synthase